MLYQLQHNLLIQFQLQSLSIVSIYLENTELLFYEVREGWPRDNESVLIVLIPSLSISQCTSHLTLLLPVSPGISSGDGSQSSLVTRDNYQHFNLQFLPLVTYTVLWQIPNHNNPDVRGDKSLIPDGVVQARPGPGRRRSFYLPRTIKQYLVRNEKEAEIIECQRGSRLNQMITIIRIRTRPICQTGQLYNWINRI